MTDTLTSEENAYYQRILAADWHDVPKGFYALPVIDMDDEDADYPVLGHKLFERKTPRTYKNGRTVGRDAWRQSYRLAPGFTWERFHENCYDSTKFSRGVDIEEILDNPEHAQAEFGQLTGRCGCCGRALTDPNSKMRGIGPECAGLRRK